MAEISFENTEVAFSSRSNKELERAHYVFAAFNNPFLTALGARLIKGALKLGAPMKGLLRNTIYTQFCGGETIDKCQNVIRKLSAHRIGAILDYAVEGKDKEEDYEATCKEIIHTIDKAAQSKDIPFCVFKPSGIGSTRLMTRIQDKKTLTHEEQAAFKNIEKRFHAICMKAFDSRVRLFIDSEESWYQDTVDSLVYQMMREFNRERTIIYNTYQMYRTDMLSRLKRAFHYAAMDDHYLGAKIVRGAYLEKERKRAEKMGYDDPIFKEKAETDKAFNRALKYCLDNKQRVSLCCGSHNEESAYYLTMMMDAHGVLPDDERVYFAQLYGMGDHISYNLAHAGYNVAKYIPYGPVKAALPYLIRRAKENTAVKGQASRELTLIRREILRRKNLQAGK